MSSLQSLILFLTVFIDFIINNSLVIMTCLIFFFPLHSWVLLWQFLIWVIFNSHFLPILGDFVRYLVRILIDFIINGSLVIMTWLYSSFLYLSFVFFGCFWQYSIWGIFQISILSHFGWVHEVLSKGHEAFLTIIIAIFLNYVFNHLILFPSYFVFIHCLANNSE